MNLAKVSANGQITVPIEIRRALNLKEGDKVIFFKRDNGEIGIGNASTMAIREAQSALSHVAENLAHPTEDDIQAWVNDIRYGKNT
jgi:AbrB family looped-hinge helix DNA binding protein